MLCRALLGVTALRLYVGQERAVLMGSPKANATLGDLGGEPGNP
jgi:hypothetical protein